MLVVYVIEGRTSLTIMVSVLVVVPPLLVAVMVYVPEVSKTVGVPVIIPDDVPKLSPAGRDGFTE